MHSHCRRLPNACAVLVALVAVLLVAVPASARQTTPVSPTEVAAVSELPASPVQETLDGLFYDWDVYELDLATFAREARAHGRVDLRLAGRLYELELEPVDLRATGFREEWIGADGTATERLSPVGTFKGQLAGDPASEVRLLILPDLLQGYIRTETSWLFLDPMVKFDRKRGWPAKDRQVVVYEEADVRPGKSILCGTEALGWAARKLDVTADGLRTVSAAAASNIYEAEVATEADFEYHQIYGSNTNSQISGIINQVDGIYESDLNLRLTISYQSVWTSSFDPYSATDPSTRLSQFRSYWNNNRSSVGRDVAHMFTGVNLDGSVIGVAYVGVVCSNPGSAYGLSQDFSLMVKLVSHEIGHNFDAIHVNQYRSSLCDGSGPIMCSTIQSSGSNSFSIFSRDDIGEHVDSHSSCLTPLESGPDACFQIQATSPTFVAVDASCSSAGSASITSYHWDWGDGNTGSGETAGHTYSFAGTYTVTLTVTDSNGLTDSTSKQTNNCLLFGGDDALCAP